ncbi:uncharacterized protein BX664DRAFT_342920 [Halteromyces radiatus]|uniref:uncharacterized protein n=1 Tax=Halteromyces radiatus TaxID=101107 RepID=UPI00221F418C|nr:uncharacterized protein BX664DRAFT_342920 [Halteromyces radiatus]KAI8078868.1 hypothetical protein BX664DRAFT_342920 [Halteromyces radiatus]
MASVTFLLTLLFVACTMVMALPLAQKRSGYNIQLNSNSAFCSFLPPHPGDDVGGTEDNGIPFCSNSSLSNTGKVFPSGFIQSAHYVKKSNYVQVTGRMNRDAYKLKSSDGGGQYDNRDINGVVCNGYKYFVNMLEPDVNQYCIRCCKSQSDCNLGLSTYGCERVVPGDYS